MKIDKSRDAHWLVLLTMLVMAIACAYLVIFQQWTVRRFLLTMILATSCLLGAVFLYAYLVKGKRAVKILWQVVLETAKDDLRKITGR